MLVNRTREGVLIFTMSGDVGPTEMGWLAVAVEAEVKGGACKIIVKMDCVEHVSYLCLNQFTRLNGLLKKYGADLRMVGPSGYVRDILKFIRVDQLFRIHATLPQAFESLCGVAAKADAPREDTKSVSRTVREHVLAEVSR